MAPDLGLYGQGRGKGGKTYGRLRQFSALRQLAAHAAAPNRPTRAGASSTAAVASGAAEHGGAGARPLEGNTLP